MCPPKMSQNAHIIIKDIFTTFLFLIKTFRKIYQNDGISVSKNNDYNVQKCSYNFLIIISFASYEYETCSLLYPDCVS